jgi:hypothetical protein
MVRGGRLGRRERIVAAGVQFAAVALSTGVAVEAGGRNANAEPPTIADRREAYRQAQAILDAGGRFVDLDKGETGLFWKCVMGTDTDVGMFQNADQIQQRVESAYFMQQKTYAEILTKECAPILAAARRSSAALLKGMPNVLKPPLDKYVAALPRMQAGIVSYASKLKTRSPVTDVDLRIQEVGAAFTTQATPESIAFEKFMVCAIPELDRKPDIQAVLEFMAATCKRDPIAFMTKVRADCGALVQNVNKTGKPSKTFETNVAKFYEEQQRQLQAWEWCGKKSRKGKKVLDLEAFLTAASDYIEARGEVVKTAREEAARITGQPLPQEKKKPGEGEEAPAPAAKPAK